MVPAELTSCINPPTRVSSDEGTMRGMAACMAGLWNVSPNARTNNAA